MHKPFVVLSVFFVLPFVVMWALLKRLADALWWTWSDAKVEWESICIIWREGFGHIKRKDGP